MLSAVVSPYLSLTNDATVTHRNETHSCYSELNYVENLYFRFFILWKLTELCRL